MYKILAKGQIQQISERLEKPFQTSWDMDDLLYDIQYYAHPLKTKYLTPLHFKSDMKNMLTNAVFPSRCIYLMANIPGGDKRLKAVHISHERD